MKRTKADKIKIVITGLLLYLLLSYTPLRELNTFLKWLISFIFIFVFLFTVEIIIERIQGTE